jgi:hypothetical protein
VATDEAISVAEESEIHRIATHLKIQPQELTAAGLAPAVPARAVTSEDARIGAGTAATCGQRLTRRPFMSTTTVPC